MQSQATEWYPPPETATEEWVVRVAAGSAVVIFSKSACSMCHVVKALFYGMGVNPIVHEVDEELRSEEIERALSSSTGTSVPAVFIGGKFVGSMDRVTTFLLNGTLVPLLKNAGAIWL